MRVGAPSAAGTLHCVSDNATSENARAAEAIALLSEAFRSHTQLSAPLVDARASATAIAWTIRVLRTAEAVAALHRLGLGDTAAPLVRSVMEHAISMLWLVERRDDAVKAIEFGHRRHQRLLRASAARGGWDLAELDPEMETAPLDLAMEQPEDWPRLKSFEQRMDDPTFRACYAAYRVESALSHASYLSGAVYVEDSNDVSFHWEPIVPPTPLRVTAMFAVIAIEALTSLLEPGSSLEAAIEQSKGMLGLDAPTGDS